VISWVTAAWGAPLGTSAGVVGGLVALDQSARHASAPSVGAWYDHRTEGSGFAWGATWGGYHRGVVGDYWTHLRTGTWVAATGGLGVSSRELAVSWELGPALAVEGGSIGEYRFLEVLPAARACAAFEVHLSGRWVGRFALGTLARGPARWDFDALFGVGVAW
jgi:hypothetical protein